MSRGKTYTRVTALKTRPRGFRRQQCFCLSGTTKNDRNRTSKYDDTVMTQRRSSVMVIWILFGGLHQISLFQHDYRFFFVIVLNLLVQSSTCCLVELQVDFSSDTLRRCPETKLSRGMPQKVSHGWRPRLSQRQRPLQTGDFWEEDLEKVTTKSDQLWFE